MDFFISYTFLLIFGFLIKIHFKFVCSISPLEINKSHHSNALNLRKADVIYHDSDNIGLTLIDTYSSVKHHDKKNNRNTRFRKKALYSFALVPDVNAAATNPQLKEVPVPETQPTIPSSQVVPVSSDMLKAVNGIPVSPATGINPVNTNKVPSNTVVSIPTTTVANNPAYNTTYIPSNTGAVIPVNNGASNVPVGKNAVMLSDTPSPHNTVNATAGPRVRIPSSDMLTAASSPTQMNAASNAAVEKNNEIYDQLLAVEIVEELAAINAYNKNSSNNKSVICFVLFTIAAIIALLAFLFYRYYYKPNSNTDDQSESSSEKSSLTPKRERNKEKRVLQKKPNKV